MKKRANRRWQTGISMLEMSFAFVVLGIAALLLWQILGPHARARQEVVSRSLVERAQDAIYAFAKLNGRLPCATTLIKGEEDCSISDGEIFPFLTVGFPESTSIEYQVSSKIPSLTGRGNFQIAMADGVSSENSRPTLKMVSLAALPGGYSTSRLLDLCASLADPELIAEPAFELQVAQTIGESPQEKVRRIVVSRMEAAGALNCAAVVAPARTYFNVLLASSIIQRGALDGVDQFNRTYWVGGWDVAQATYAFAASCFALSKATWLSTNAYLRYVINEGTPNYDTVGQLVYIGYGVVAAGLAFTSSLTAFDAVGRLGLALGAAADIKGEMEKNQSDLVLLDAGIRERAIQSANSTYFLEPSL